MAISTSPAGAPTMRTMCATLRKGKKVQLESTEGRPRLKNLKVGWGMALEVGVPKWGVFPRIPIRQPPRISPCHVVHITITENKINYGVQTKGAFWPLSNRDLFISFSKSFSLPLCPPRAKWG